MKKTKHQDVSDLPIWVQGLPETLWNTELPVKRPSGFRVLFSERYRGRHTDRTLTEHGFWEFVCILSGTGTFISESGVLALRECSVILVPPGVSHYELSEHNLDTIWLGFKCGRLFAKSFPSLSCVEDESLIELVKRIWIASEKKTAGSGFEIDAYFMLLLNRYYNAVHQKGVNDLRGRIDTAIKFMNENYQGSLSMAELARSCGLSEGYFYRSFNKLTGLSPQSYLNNVRMRSAANMLLRASVLPLYEVAEACGFKDVFYFSRTFKKYFGISPKFYRIQRLKSAGNTSD